MRRSILSVLWVLACLAPGGCGGDDDTDACGTRSIPLSGEIDAPTLTDATLECQGTNINVLITATDPQGDPDLIDVIQTVGVFRDRQCDATPKNLTDDLAGSGLEESFGVVFQSGTDPNIFAEICASSTWPIEVHLVDAQGNQTNGRVLATVVH